ncbi:MAG: aminoacyl-tRNA deacylase [Candidatus Bipolaricaulota bacterium]
MKENLVSILEEEDIEYNITTHEPVYTSKEASEVRGVPLDTGVKAMVLERDDGELVLGLVPADHEIDLESIRKEEGQKVELADPDEVLDVCGCEVGSVPPFGHHRPLKTYLDSGVLSKDRINFNAGEHEVSIDMDANDLPECILASGAKLIRTEIKEQWGLNRQSSNVI